LTYPRVERHHSQAFELQTVRLARLWVLQTVAVAIGFSVVPMRTARPVLQMLGNQVALGSSILAPFAVPLVGMAVVSV
jgi:hypothetical protein